MELIHCLLSGLLPARLLPYILIKAFWPSRKRLIHLSLFHVKVILKSAPFNAHLIIGYWARVWSPNGKLLFFNAVLSAIVV